MDLRLYKKEPGNAKAKKLRTRKEGLKVGYSSTWGDHLGKEFSARRMHLNRVVYHPCLRTDRKYH